VLSDIVLYLVSRFPRGAGRTRIMKLLFLVDAEARKELGRPVTGVEWRRWLYGPFSREVLEVLDELVIEGRLASDPGPETRYKALDEPPELPGEVRRIVDRVVGEYGFLPLRELLRRVYESYGVDRLGLGEKIEFDWDEEILKLVEGINRDREALAELVGRLYEGYLEALEVLPRNTLALYAIAVSNLSARDSKRAEELTRELLGLLEELSEYIRKGGAKSPLPTELRRKAKAVYEELVDAAAQAVGG